jgi:galactoside O-acetyltransferase
MIGNNVNISKKTSLYAISGSIGDNVRIDDFCILKGNIILEAYNHIAGFCLLSGVCGSVTLRAGATLSSSVHIYTGSDDYYADALSSSTVPKEYTRTVVGPVYIGLGSIVGCQTVLLPNTIIEDGASVGAHCLLYGKIPSGSVMVRGSGKPKCVGKRNTEKILELVNRLIKKD